MTALALILLAAALPAGAVSKFDLLSKAPTAADFRLVDGGAAADIYVSPGEWECNRKGAEDLANDIFLVTGVRPRIRMALEGLTPHAVLIGTLGRGGVIDRLAKENRIAAQRIRGAWEGSLVQVVERPAAGVERALVLAGSDRRGTKYAIYEISDNIGVSPYFKLHTVLPPRRKRLYVKAGALAVEQSFVKYRGSFADDNRASTGVFMTPGPDGRLYGGWAAQRGGWTTRNYVDFGEWDALIRSKSNTYFPCEGLYTNIPFNHLPDGNDVLIEEYGLVRSGGHLMALLTTWVNEFPAWLKSKGYDPNEPFHYRGNHARVVEFWKHSIERNRRYEVLWPLGLRGADDYDYREPGVADAAELVRQATLEQARLLAETPGLASRDMIITGWRSDYGVVERGLIPPGAAYAFSDGALPGATWYDVVPVVTPEQRARNPQAHWGAYFHNSVRMGTIQRVARDQNPGLAKLNHEFNMLLDHGMTFVWEINNGPYKGMQYANEYIATLGRDPAYWRDPMKMDEFLHRVMRRDFGEAHAAEIARIYRRMDTRNLMNYGTLRRGMYGIGVEAPEFYCDPYSIANFGDEYRRALDAFDRDLASALSIHAKLEPQQRDGFWQAIVWPLKLHIAALKQHYYGYKATLAWKQGRRSARVFLAEMEKAARMVSQNALDYQTVAGGFWFGFTQNDPRERPRGEEIWGYNTHPAGQWYHEIAAGGRHPYTLSERYAKLREMVDAMHFDGPAALDVSVEGLGEKLPVFSVFNRETRFFDIGNKGGESFAWSAKASRPWIRVQPSSGVVHAADQRVWVSIDWDRAPQVEREMEEELIVDAGPAGRRVIALRIQNPSALRPETVEGHVEVDGYLSIEAEHYTRHIPRGGAEWRRSRISFADGGWSMYSYPLTKSAASPLEAPELVYHLHFQNAGRYYLNFVLFDRTLYKNFYFALDSGAPVLVDSNYPRRQRDDRERNIPVVVDRPGRHVLHVWMKDPGVVMDQIVFTRQPAEFGTFRLFEPVKESHPCYRAAVAPESYRRAPQLRKKVR
jgi:hypothetical protein